VTIDSRESVCVFSALNILMTDIDRAFACAFTVVALSRVSLGTGTLGDV